MVMLQTADVDQLKKELEALVKRLNQSYQTTRFAGACHHIMAYNSACDEATRLNKLIRNSGSEPLPVTWRKINTSGD